MKNLWILSTLLLTGCIAEDNYNYEVKYPDIMYVGDSLCYSVRDSDEGDKYFANEDYQKTAQALLGIKSNCIPGRSVLDID